MPPRVAASAQLALLEVAPGTAKLLVGSLGPPARLNRLHSAMPPAGLPAPPRFASQSEAGGARAGHEDDPTAALRVLLDAHAIGGREVGVVLSRETFSLQTLELPSTNTQEITSMMELQLGKLTPYPRAEIVSASHIIGSMRSGYTTVLLAIARKSVLEAILHVLKAKGVVPRWIGVSSEGLAHWWQHAGLPASLRSAQAGHTQVGARDAQKLLALIDVDRTSTDCTLLANDQAIFSHSLAIGHTQLAESEPSKTRWVGELVRLPRVLLHEGINGTIGQGVLLGGSGPQAGALSQQLSASWSVPVETAEPLAGVAREPSAASGGAESVSWTALFGFLLHGQAPQLDLIPHETRAAAALQRRARQFAQLVGSLAAVLLLVGVWHLQRLTILRGYLQQLRHELAQVEHQGSALGQMQQYMRGVRQWVEPSQNALELLSRIAEGVTPEVVITHVALEQGKPVVVRGRAQSTAEAFAFFKRLETSGAFASVQSTSVAKVKGAEAYGADFEVVCMPNNS